MKLQILAIGKSRAGAAQDLWTDYADRIEKLSPSLGFRKFELREFTESDRDKPSARKAREAEILIEAAKQSVIIALDERGRDFPSQDFAARLGTWRDDGTDTLTFVIGGPDGLDASMRKKARQTLCFGKQTWPHLMVRAMLAEQIYRAMTILAGHPYHRQ